MEIAQLSLEDRIIKSIARVAGQVIIAIAPEYQQRNMIARAVEIADAKANGVATEADLAELDVLRSTWAKIIAIRTKSNDLETQYLAEGNELYAEDIAEIKAELEGA